MAYDYKTGKYSFDFDSVKFPLQLSDLMIDYLYQNYRGDCFSPLSLEQFKDILRGNDRSQVGCKVLGKLFYVHNGHCEFPPDCFVILSDKLVSSELVKEYADIKEYEDVHQGECKYEDNIFNFEYVVTRKLDCYHNFEGSKRGKTTVVLKGHSLKNEDSYMHEACSSYIDVETKLEEERIRREGEKAEEKIWIEFRMAHKQELKDWLISIIEKQYKFRICPRMKSSVYNGYPSFGLVRALDRGECNYCTGRCMFKVHVLEGREHTKEWYDLGLDKLNFKYI